MRTFFGARHGKSEADRVVGQIKQRVSDAVKSRKTTIRNAKEFFDFCTANRKEIEERIRSHNANFGKEKKCMHFQKFFLVEDIDRNVKMTAVGTHYMHQFHQVRSTGSPLIVQFREVGCLCPSCLGDGSACPNQGYAQDWKTVNLSFGRKHTDTAFVNTHWGLDRQEDIQLPEQLSSDFNWDYLYTRVCGCASFEELRRFVQLTTLPEVQQKSLPVWQQGIIIDEVARSEFMMLTDADHLSPCIPVTTVGDENCLPHAASKLMFGTEENHLEVRMRLVFEAVKNENQYLCEDYLLEGAKQRMCGTLLTQMYAMYSGHYTGLNQFSCMEVAIQDLPEGCYEYMQKNNLHGNVSDVCIVQCNAVANSFSIPAEGKPQFRDDFHRQVLPLHNAFRERTSAIIMWTPMHIGGHVVHFVLMIRSKMNVSDFLL